MEKIYEEKNFENKRKGVGFSIVLSFVVAAFAIVSLIAVGFNQISYAAPVAEEKITVHFGKKDGYPLRVEGADGSGHTLYVPLMFANSDNPEDASNTPVFCIEQGIDATDTDSAYSSQSEETFTDAGLVYILNQSKVLGGDGILPGGLTYPGSSDKSGALDANDARYLETYATQIAIWQYLSEQYGAGDPKHGKLEENSQGDVLRGNSNIYVSNGSELKVLIYSGNMYDGFIKDVVNKAKANTNIKTIQSVVSSSNISKVGDDDIYQTDKIYVQATPSSDLVNYSVDLSGLDGAYVVDKDGNTKQSTDTFAPSDYFYIRVPVNKVTDQNSTVNIVISGEFTNYVRGDFYVADGKQSIVKATDYNPRIDNINQVNFLVAPDTGMTTAQTIYFIGLIVLLCGVGIIYANAKPVQDQ